MDALLWTVLDPLGQLQAPSAARRLFLPRAVSLSACIHSTLMYDLHYCNWFFQAHLSSIPNVVDVVAQILCLDFRLVFGSLGLGANGKSMQMWKRSKFHQIFQGQGSSMKSSAALSGFGNETSIPKARLGTSTTAPYRITLTANLGDWNWCCRFAALAFFSTFSSFASSFPAFSSAHLSLM